MDPALAFQERFAVLVVSSRWPALTQLFVERIHSLGRCILGVYDALEPAGREHLDALGVDGTVPNDAPIAVLLDELHAVARSCRRRRRRGRRRTPRSRPAEEAMSMRGRRGRWSSSAARPARVGARWRSRSRTASPLVEHRCCSSTRTTSHRRSASDSARPSSPTCVPRSTPSSTASAAAAACVRRIAPRLDLLCGVPNAALWAQVRATEVLDVLRTVDADYGSVVADVGSSLEELDGGARSRFGIARTVVGAGRRARGRRDRDARRREPAPRLGRRGPSAQRPGAHPSRRQPRVAKRVPGIRDGRRRSGARSSRRR